MSERPRLQPVIDILCEEWDQYEEINDALQAKLDALLPVLVQMKGHAEYELGEKPDAIFSQRNPHALKSGAERGLAILEGKE